MFLFYRRLTSLREYTGFSILLTFNTIRIVNEKSSSLKLLILPLVSRFSQIIRKLKKLDKQIPYELNENKKLRHFEKCSMITLRNTNDPFIYRIVTETTSGSFTLNRNDQSNHSLEMWSSALSW